LNPRLVACLFAATLVGVSTAVTALSFGWGVIVALLLWSLCGSVTLVLAAAMPIPSAISIARPATPPASAASGRRGHAHA
jgi:hypothetical protein